MSLPELLQTIDALKAEIDALRPLPTETEQRILQKFRLDWNYHSNAMEGNSLTQSETETFIMEGLTAKGKPLKDHLDIKGHNTAINFLLEFVRHPESPLTEADLRELHRILLVEPYQVPAETAEGLPTRKTIAIGEYKTGLNNVRTPTGEIHFYATPEDTPAKMGDLMRWYREESQKGELHPVIIAAIFHHRFTAIHPFDDGNGRMSRLLMNLILMQCGYPPVVLQTQNRNEYLFALRAADQGSDANFVLLIVTNLTHSLELYLKGAQGESLEESDDIDKRVALLKQELKHIHEPAHLTAQQQAAFFEGQGASFLEVLSRRLAAFDELFSANFVALECTYLMSGSCYEIHDQITKEEILAKIKHYLSHSHFERISLIKIHLYWLGFKRDYSNRFNIDVETLIEFDDLRYTFTVPIKDLKVSKLHQQNISDREILALTSALKSACLDQIVELRETV